MLGDRGPCPSPPPCGEVPLVETLLDTYVIEERRGHMICSEWLMDGGRVWRVAAYHVCYRSIAELTAPSAVTVTDTAITGLNGITDTC